jgi:hypothetical protein
MNNDVGFGRKDEHCKVLKPLDFIPIYNNNKTTKNRKLSMITTSIRVNSEQMRRRVKLQWRLSISSSNDPKQVIGITLLIIVQKDIGEWKFRLSHQEVDIISQSISLLMG